jgi:DNA-binding PadR family transcriptional regulator
MSVRLGLMALLSGEPMYGARLRAMFEERTGGTWPLNVGQVYTTLARLERDGLVAQAGPADEEGRISYVLTEDGRAEVRRWWLHPVDRESTPRDELVIKLALAVTMPDVDVRVVAQTQRTATLTHLRDLTRLKQKALEQHEGADGSDHDLAWLLVLENLIFSAEAEVRWLDHIETRLAREAARTAAARPIGAEHTGRQPATDRSSTSDHTQDEGATLATTAGDQHD